MSSNSNNNEDLNDNKTEAGTNNSGIGAAVAASVDIQAPAVRPGAVSVSSAAPKGKSRATSRNVNMNSIRAEGGSGAPRAEPGAGLPAFENGENNSNAAVSSEDRVMAVRGRRTAASPSGGEEIPQVNSRPGAQSVSYAAPSGKGSRRSVTQTTNTQGAQSQPGATSMAHAAPQGKSSRRSVNLDHSASQQALMDAAVSPEEPSAVAVRSRPGATSMAHAAPQGKSSRRSVNLDHSASQQALMDATVSPEEPSAVAVRAKSTPGASPVHSPAPVGKPNVLAKSTSLDESYGTMELKDTVVKPKEPSFSGPTDSSGNADEMNASVQGMSKPGVTHVSSAAPRGKARRSTSAGPVSASHDDMPSAVEPGATAISALEGQLAEVESRIIRESRKSQTGRAARRSSRNKEENTSSRTVAVSSGLEAFEEKYEQKMQQHANSKPNGTSKDDDLKKSILPAPPSSLASFEGRYEAKLRSNGLGLSQPPQSQMAKKGSEKLRLSDASVPSSLSKTEQDLRDSVNSKRTSGQSATSHAMYGGRRISDEDENIVSATIINEEDLEAEYQEKMMKTAVQAEILSEEDLKQEGGSCWRILFPCCCLAVLLSIILPLTISNEPATKTIVNVTQAPTMSPTLLSDYNYLEELFFNISGGEIRQEGTPQYQALNWLAYEDSVIQPVRETNMTVLTSRYVLAVYYLSLGGPYWFDDMSFMSDKSHCDWDSNVTTNRVDCFEDGTAEISKVVVSSNNVSGTLPKEMAALSRLEGFTSNLGDIHGTLPPEYNKLANIVTLQFAINSLTGTIPQSYTGFSKIQAMSFYDNLLSGTVPEGLFDSKELNYLLLPLNSLTGTIPEIDIFGKLNYFVLFSNQFTGTVPRSLYTHKNLVWVYLNDNKLTGTIPAAVGEIPVAQHYRLQNNQMTGTIPSQLGQLEGVEYLYLHNNAFTGTIPPELGNLESVVDINLSSNNFNGTLPASLALVEDLATLNVANNPSLTGSIPDSFIDSGLKQFLLQNTSISSGLNSQFCNRTSLYTDITASCGGEEPAIDCDCCTSCCDENGFDCELGLNGVCEVTSAGFQVEEERGTECQCTEDGSSFACTDTCSACNLDGTVCVQSTNYGYTFNETTGDIISFRNELQYVKGRNETVVFTDYLATTDCVVEVDGVQCNLCRTITCSGGTLGYTAQCENLEVPFAVSTCTLIESGYLEFFYLTQPSLLRDGCAPVVIVFDDI